MSVTFQSFLHFWFQKYGISASIIVCLNINIPYLLFQWNKGLICSHWKDRNLVKEMIDTHPFVSSKPKPPELDFLNDHDMKQVSSKNEFICRR